MTKKERIRAALRGEAVDRVPVSLWGHDFLREWSPEDLVAATMEQYGAYDWDFIKLNPRSTYYYEAWGNRYEPTDAAHQPRLTHSVVQQAADLARLQEIDPAGGPFGEQLRALRMVLAQTNREVDVIQTVFCPIGVAGRLGGREQPILRQLAAEDPAAVHTGLATITRTLIAYCRASIAAGASGIFLATLEWSSRDIADEDFYREFGRPYDLQILDAVREAPFNIMHVCKEHNMLPLFLDYPVAAFNWANHGAGNPSLRDILSRTQRAVMGGVDEQTIDRIPASEVERQAEAALAETGMRRLLLTGGCAIPPGTPEANRRALRAAAEHPAA
ncbi:MAG: uroporphyrinogen decarboxylase family protein [Dehalococcoidia bacterium]